MANDTDWSDCAKEDWDRQPDGRAGDLAAAARVLTRRPLPGRLRYLAEQLRRGADPIAVSIALDATATEIAADTAPAEVIRTAERERIATLAGELWGSRFAERLREDS